VPLAHLAEPAAVGCADDAAVAGVGARLPAADEELGRAVDAGQGEGLRRSGGVGVGRVMLVVGGGANFVSGGAPHARRACTRDTGTGDAVARDATTRHAVVRRTSRGRALEVRALSAARRRVLVPPLRPR